MYFKCKDTRLKINRSEKIYQVNSKHKKTEVAIVLSDKVDLKTESITRDNDR